MTGNSSVAVNRRTTAKSLVWSTVENGGLALISFVSLIVYLRLLSASDFGLYAAALALVEVLGVLVTMLFHNALVQRLEITERHFDTAFCATLALSLVMALACRALAPLFAALLHRPSAAPVLAWMALVFPCSGVSATLVARQRRELEFRSLAMRSLIGRLAGGGIGIAAALLGAGLWSLVLQQILIAAISSAVLWVSAARRPRLRFGCTEFRQLIGFGTLSVSGLLLSTSMRRIYTLLASFLLGVEAAGYLNLSFRVVDVFWAIAATAVSQVALPMLAGLQSEPGAIQARLSGWRRSSPAWHCTRASSGWRGRAGGGRGAVRPPLAAERALRAGARLPGAGAGAAPADHPGADRARAAAGSVGRARRRSSCSCSGLTAASA